MTATDSDPYRDLDQWTEADLAAAREAGDHQRITAAHNAGRLRNLLTQRKPEPTQTTPRWSAPITNTDADLARARHITDEFEKGRRA